MTSEQLIKLANTQRLERKADIILERKLTKQERKKLKKKEKSNWLIKKNNYYRRKKQEKKDRKADYNLYLDSLEWQIKRKEAFDFYGKACQRCEKTHHLHVHHMTYARFKNELITDLAILCNTCHEEYHKLNKTTNIVKTKTFISYTQGINKNSKN